MSAVNLPPAPEAGGAGTKMDAASASDATIVEGATASAFVERYDDRIVGVLSCYDRVVVTGTLPTVCLAGGMTRFLNANQIRIFDYPTFAATLRDHVCERAAAVAAEAGISVEHVGKSHVRKEAIVVKVLDQRGEHPGQVHVISAMEACDAYKPWYDKQTHKTYLRSDSGKCLHYCFNFMDAELGQVYLRVSTWSPFRLQFYCNGHSWLARQLTAAGIGFTAADNAGACPREGRGPSTTGSTPSICPTSFRPIYCTVLDRYAVQWCPVLDNAQCTPCITGKPG
jgi:hypothetical protein